MKYTKHALVLAAVVAAVYGSGAGAQADLIDWTDLANDGLWASSGNWVGVNMPPLATDVARFNLLAYGTASVNTGIAVIAGLQIGDGATASAPLTLSGTALTIGSSGITMYNNALGATITATSTYLDGSQSWANQSAALLTVGALTNASSTASATLTLSGSGSGGTTFAGIISDNTGAGPVSIIVNTGGGATSLNVANTFSGGVNLTGGTLIINNSLALGTGTFSIYGGTLDSTTGVNITQNNPQSWNGDFAFAGSQNLNLGAGTVTLSAARTVTVNGSTLTVGGLITGTSLNALDITKAGVGTLALTYVGAPVAVRAGGQTLSCTSGTLTLATPIDTNAGTLTADVAVSSSVSLNGSISGTSGIIKNGLGNLTLATANDFAGGVTLNSGTLAITNNNALGTGTLTINGGSLTNSFGIVVANNLQNWNGSFTFVGAQNLNLGTGAVTVGASLTLTTTAGVLTVGGPLSASGAYNLIKDGAGSLVLNGSISSFSGTITVNAGALTLSNANTFDGGVTLGSSGTLVVNNNAALGTGTLTINGGTLSNNSTATMSNNNGQTWNAGFTFGVNGTATLNLGTGPVTLAVAPTVTFGANKTLIVGGVISGTSLNALDIVKSGVGGTLNFTNTSLVSVRTGGQTVSCTSGTLIVAAPIDPVDNLNVSVASGSLVTLSGAIGPSAGGIRKDGLGTLILSGSNNFSGGVNVTSGILYLQNNSCLGTGTLTIGAGTSLFALGGSGGVVNLRNNLQTWQGDFTFDFSGSSSVNKLNLGTGAVTLTNNVQITTVKQPLTVGGPISGSGYNLTQTGAGDLILNGNITTGTGSVTVNGVFAAYGSNTELYGTNTFSGGVHLQSGTLIIGSNSALGTGTFTIEPGTAFWGAASFNDANVNPQIWNGDFYVNYSGGSSGMKLNMGTGAITMTNNVNVTVYAQTLTLGGDVTGSGYNLTKSDVGRLVFNGAIKTGTGSVTLNNGILILGSNNTFSGGVTVNPGTGTCWFGFYAPGAIGTGTFTINGGLIYALYGSTGVVNSNNNAQIWNASFTYNYAGAAANTALDLGTGPVTMTNNITITTAARTLTVGGTISGNGLNITQTGAGALALNGAINTGTGSVTVNGTPAAYGTSVHLGGANTFSGGVHLQTGTLDIGNSAALGTGTFTIDAGTTIYVSSNNMTTANNNPQIWNGNFTYMYGGNMSLDLGTGPVTLNNNVTVTVNDTLSVGGVIAGNFNITQTGPKLLNFNGAINTGTGSVTVNGTPPAYGTSVYLGSANSFSGGVHLQTGTLSIGNSAALGTGTFTIDAGTTIYVSSNNMTTANNNPQSWNGNFTYMYGGNMSLDLGTGPVTLNNNVTVTVNDTLSVGGVIAGNFNITQTGPKLLNFNGAINTGTGSVTVNGTPPAYGTSVYLGSANSFSGGVHLQTGTLSIGNSAALGTGTFTIDAGTSIYVPGNMTTANNNPQIWNGDFTYMWGVGGSLDLGTGAVTMNNNVQVTTNDRLTVGGTITGSGTNLAKAGASTLTLNGAVNLGAGSITVNAGTLILGTANAYAGGAAVNAGTLIVGNTQALGSGPVTVSSTTNVLACVRLQTGLFTAAPLTFASSSMLTFSGGTMSQLDVTNNYVVISGAAGSLSTYAPHIMTSTTLAGYAVAAAVVTGQEYFDVRGGDTTSTFAGATVQAADLLARVAMAGDVNLDGTISIDDYLAIDSGSRFGGTDWAHGDFNGDGEVDFQDYALIDHNYGLSNPDLAAAEETLHAAEFGSAYVSALDAFSAPVPEPTSLALLGLGAAALLRRRRSKA